MAGLKDSIYEVDLPHSADQPIAFVKHIMQQWISSQSTYEDAAVDDLLLMKTPSAPDGYLATNELVYVPFASRGMLAILKYARGKLLKLVVDGKQKVLNNGYTVLTLAFLIGSVERKWSKVLTHGYPAKPIELHTTTAQPLFQALVHKETAETLTMAFQDAIWFCHEFGQLELKDQLMQLHKDYAKAIEAARQAVFSFVRALDDYFHLKQNVQPMLDTKLNTLSKVDAPTPENPASCKPAPQEPSNPPRASGACANREDPAVLEPSHRGSVARAGASKVAKSGRTGATKHKVAPKRRGRKSKNAKQFKHKSMILDILNFSRSVPTLSLFDILWRATFKMLEKEKEKDAADYLCETYFHKVPLSNVQKLFKGITAAAYGCNDMLIAGHWIGVFGTYLGTGSGSQSIETVHSQWEAEVKMECRSSVVTFLPAMQTLYRKWKGLFRWGENLDFNYFPTDVNPALVNGRSLAGHGRSTAKEYFVRRHQRNFVKVVKTTGDINDDGLTGARTTFYVVQAHKHDGVKAADATITKPLAEDIVNLLVLQGTPLAEHMERLGIIADYEEEAGCHTKVDVDKLKYYLHTFAVVVQGHLQRKYWPRYGRRTRDMQDFRLCTCLTYSQHAECEHKTFIDGVEDPREGRNLSIAPQVRQKGRKRKAAEL